MSDRTELVERLTALRDYIVTYPTDLNAQSMVNKIDAMKAILNRFPVIERDSRSSERLPDGCCGYCIGPDGKCPYPDPYPSTPAERDSGAVKALEWHELRDGKVQEYGHAFAETPCGKYRIVDLGRNWKQDRYSLELSGKDLGSFPTDTAALAAAQADYTKRILSALTASPAPQKHWSDCAVNNAPAMEPGPCDCGGYTPASPAPEPVAGDRAETITEGWRDIATWSPPRNGDRLLFHDPVLRVITGYWDAEDAEWVFNDFAGDFLEGAEPDKWRPIDLPPPPDGTQS